MQPIALLGPFSNGYCILAGEARGKLSQNGNEGRKEKDTNVTKGREKDDRQCCVRRIHFPIALSFPLFLSIQAKNVMWSMMMRKRSQETRDENGEQRKRVTGEFLLLFPSHSFHPLAFLDKTFLYFCLNLKVPFREAHEVTGRVVAKAEQLQCDLSQVNVQQLRSIRYLPFLPSLSPRSLEHFQTIQISAKIFY